MFVNSQNIDRLPNVPTYEHHRNGVQYHPLSLKLLNHHPRRPHRHPTHAWRISQTLSPCVACVSGHTTLANRSHIRTHKQTHMWYMPENTRKWLFTCRIFGKCYPWKTIRLQSSRTYERATHDHTYSHMTLMSKWSYMEPQSQREEDTKNKRSGSIIWKIPIVHNSDSAQ